MSATRPSRLPGFTLIFIVVLGALVYLLDPIVTPFLSGALAAYMFDPLADRLQARGFSRTLATTVVILFVAAALIERLPTAPDVLHTRLLPWLARTLGIHIGAPLDTVKACLTENATENGANGLPTLTSGALAFAGVLANLFLLPVVMFYLLRDRDVLVARIGSLAPRPRYATVARVAREMDQGVGEFLRGQLAVMATLSLQYSGALWAVGIDYALPIGILTGVLSFVPFMGFGLGWYSHFWLPCCNLPTGIPSCRSRGFI